MTYGNPGIPSHGVFDTYYVLYTFQFNAADQVAVYNTQENPGAAFTVGKGLYYAAFTPFPPGTHTALQREPPIPYTW